MGFVQCVREKYFYSVFTFLKYHIYLKQKRTRKKLKIIGKLYFWKIRYTLVLLARFILLSKVNKDKIFLSKLRPAFQIPYNCTL